VFNNEKFNNEQKNTVPHCQLSLSADAKILFQYCRYHRHCLHQPVIFVDLKYLLSVDSKSHYCSHYYNCLLQTASKRSI